MNCLCDAGKTYELKIEGDVGADPIWCGECKCNLELADLSLSNELKSGLWEWIRGYGTWIDWDKDEVVPNGIELEAAHNVQGKELTAKVQKELEGKYIIRFSPSRMVRHTILENKAK